MTDINPRVDGHEPDCRGSYPVAGASSARYQSRSGYWFDLNASTWRLDKNNIVLLGKIRESLCDEVFHGFVSTLASDNLVEFIRMCRDDLTVFGVDLNWNDTSWPKVANFTKLGVHSRGFRASDRMEETFIDFAKAYFRYQQGHRPTGTKNESKALRVIEAALSQAMGSARLTGLNFAILDEAAVLARGHYSPMVAYHCGRELQRLARFVSEKHLIQSDLSTWKNPIKKPSDITIQTGAKARAIQEKKLPSQEALDALAEIFASDPSDPKDIFTSSTFAMTMCAPVRISEILELPVDCEVEERDSKGLVQYGWRFYSAKGYEGDVKWVPEVMVPVAKEAIRRIRILTAESRRLAAWIEKHPTTFYRHESCPNVADDQFLSAEQAARALGFVSMSNTGVTAAGCVYTLKSLWEYVMKRQPEGFPWLNKEKKVRFSNALFCMSRNLIGDQRGTSPVILWAPTNNVFNNDLSPRGSLKSNHQSIFIRYGYKACDGNHLKLTSHQARHLVCTLANRGGLTQEQLGAVCLGHRAPLRPLAKARQNQHHTQDFQESISPGNETTSISGAIRVKLQHVQSNVWRDHQYFE